MANGGVDYAKMKESIIKEIQSQPSCIFQDLSVHNETMAFGHKSIITGVKTITITVYDRNKDQRINGDEI